VVAANANAVLKPCAKFFSIQWVTQFDRIYAERVLAGFSFVIKRESNANKTTERNKKRVEDYLVRVFDRASPERGTYSWRKNPRD
jgi:hypothetical protein